MTWKAEGVPKRKPIHIAESEFVLLFSIGKTQAHGDVASVLVSPEVMFPHTIQYAENTAETVGPIDKWITCP